MKILKKVLIIGLSVIVLAVVGGTLFMFDTSLKTKVEPTDEQDSYTYLFEHKYLKQWIDSLNSVSALRDTFIVAKDGARLHGLYVRAAEETPNTALIIHGYTDNAVRMLMIGHLYNKEMGYNILLPDLRAHGQSDGEYIQMGWKDRLDILEWIDVCKQLYGDSINMVLHGISMGAATTMMTSGEDLPDNVKCFVEDCGYTSVWDEFSYKLGYEYALPQFPLMYCTSLYCQWREGWNFKEASPLNQLANSKKPMLFIHGDADTYIPVEMVHRLFETKSGEKELWVVPGVEHAKAYWDYTDEYVARTKNFVGKYIDK
jgi:fermentation-respiration switch protein FrsA (DUF1100 family)